MTIHRTGRVDNWITTKLTTEIGSFEDTSWLCAQVTGLVSFMQENFTQACMCVFLPVVILQFASSIYFSLPHVWKAKDRNNFLFFKVKLLQLLISQFRLLKSTPETQCQLNTFSGYNKCRHDRSRARNYIYKYNSILECLWAVCTQNIFLRA